MKKYFLGVIVAVSAAAVTVPAFASGYGPAPFYRPETGAPASQRGQSAQTVAAESAGAAAANSYGGSTGPTVQSGSRETGLSGFDNLFSHH